MEKLSVELQRSTSKIDSNYSGQYDFWLNDSGNANGGIKIEVKALGFILLQG